MRTTDFAPDDARAGRTLCEALHPFHDLSPDLTCLRPLGHEWEHATQLTGSVEGLRYDWVWWGDPQPYDRTSEEARLEAVAYVSGNLAKQVAKHEVYLAVGHRFRRFVLWTILAVLLSIYLSAGAFSRFVAECYQVQYVGKWRAVICDHVFPGDPSVEPGLGRSYQKPAKRL